MRQTAIIALLSIVTGTGLFLSQEQTASVTTSADNSPSMSEAETAIRAEAKAFVEAFNKGDATAVAALWTESGEYIDESGNVHSGREAIEQGYTQFFAENKGAAIQLEIESIRVFGDSTAIEEGTSILNGTAQGDGVAGRYTVIHTKVGDAWKMASVRDVPVEAPLAERNLSDLDWLIGTWVAEEHGNRNESVCRWVSDNHFVERKYTITHVDGSQVSGVQIIGWNPQTQHVQSWTFGPDGSHAVGQWLPVDGGWSAVMQGTTGDGAPSTATNLLTRLDDNAYVWKSVNRTVGSVLLPDTDDVVIKRQP